MKNIAMLHFSIRLTCIAAILALSACSFGWLPGGYRQLLQEGDLPTAAQRERLRVGMSERQVLQLLGEPVLRDAFHRQLWYYILREEHTKRRVEEHCLKLRFDDGTLRSIAEGRRTAMLKGDPQPWCNEGIAASKD